MLLLLYYIEYKIVKQNNSKLMIGMDANVSGYYIGSGF